MLEALPHIRNWDSFIASIPPIRYKLRTDRTIRRRISWIAPGELVSAHLHYSDDYLAALQRRRCVPFFIFRDLRDVAVSEAHYLTYMNRFHRLHQLFASLPDDASRVLLAITGLREGQASYRYPGIGERFAPYRAWLTCERACAVKFEDLVAGSRETTVLRMAEWFRQISGLSLNNRELASAMLRAVEPSRSRTFRTGQSGEWKSVFDERHYAAFTTPLRELLVATGHETRTDW